MSDRSRKQQLCIGRKHKFWQGVGRRNKLIYCRCCGKARAAIPETPEQRFYRKMTNIMKESRV